MANMYYETAWFAGPVDQMKELRQILTIRGGSSFVELKTSDEPTVGWGVNYDETPYSLSLTAQMRYDPLGASFYDISQRVPDLFMASSSHCIYDNRYLLVAGFGPWWHFFAQPPLFTDDWEPITGITGDDQKLLWIAWNGFHAAFGAACKTFRRGGRMPRLALRILDEAQSRYDDNDPPENL